MPPAIPRATYRVQLSADFGFDQVAAIVPYLQALGVSHLYASPFLKARPGSKHGYDTVDPSLLNPEFGGEDAFARLSDALERADMGLILDFVPNHMGVGYADNAWWLDV
ncbi:MAG: alpha-amylase family glycosyl hydrolase, partial [Xanthobacteraceae bacterium]